MAEATDIQMQRYADERIRPRAEQIRAVLLAMQSDKAAIDDAYARASGANPWDDSRADGPPHLLDEQSMLKFNAFIDSVITSIAGHTEYANVMAMCVRPAGG